MKRVIYVKRLDVERVFRNYGKSISVPSYERLPRGASTMTSVAESGEHVSPPVTATQPRPGSQLGIICEKWFSFCNYSRQKECSTRTFNKNAQ